jgi:hypothetical protein
LTDWSGGVAMAKLANGQFLLLANEGGNSAGRSHLFQVEPFAGLAEDTTVQATEVGEASYPAAAMTCAEHHHSENVSLITECGTGQLYAVHVGSNDAARAPNFEAGGFQTFWRVSRVVAVDQHATLEPVGTYLRMAHLGYCHGRSAGSAFVDPETRQITLLCHERDQFDPKHGPWRFWSEAADTAPLTVPGTTRPITTERPPATPR